MIAGVWMIYGACSLLHLYQSFFPHGYWKSELFRSTLHWVLSTIVFFLPVRRVDFPFNPPVKSAKTRNPPVKSADQTEIHFAKNPPVNKKSTGQIAFEKSTHQKSTPRQEWKKTMIDYKTHEQPFIFRCRNVATLLVCYSILQFVSTLDCNYETTGSLLTQ